jgi:hypothetical protein
MKPQEIKLSDGTPEKNQTSTLSNDTGPSGHESLVEGVLNEYGSNYSYAHEKNSISIDDLIHRRM